MPQQVVIQIESGEITIGSVHLIRLIVVVHFMFLRQAISMLLMSSTTILRCEQLSNFRYRPRIYVKLKENLKHYIIKPLNKLKTFASLKKILKFHNKNFSMLFIGHAFIYLYILIFYMYPYYKKFLKAKVF